MDYSNEIREYIITTFLFGSTEFFKDFGDTTSFMESGIIDSTGILELVGHLEKRYGITVAENELVPENLDSISNVNAYLQRTVK